MKIIILDANNKEVAKSKKSGYGVSLVYQKKYEAGDKIRLQVEQEGLYCVQLDEALGKHPIYLKPEATFEIPIEEEQRTCYPARNNFV